MDKLEELVKRQVQAHQEWLKHPTTQDLIRVINSRGQEFTRQLQEGILSSSNEALESKLRVAITTCNALSLLIKDSNLFVKQQNKQDKQLNNTYET